MSKGLGFSPADLQSGLKKLETVEDSGAKTESKTNQGEDKQTIAEIQALKDVYNELNGNIEEIFLRYSPQRGMRLRLQIWPLRLYILITFTGLSLSLIAHLATD